MSNKEGASNYPELSSDRIERACARMRMHGAASAGRFATDTELRFYLIYAYY